MASREQIREAMFRLRYAIEGTTVAMRQLHADTYGWIEDELRRRRTARKAAAARQAQDRELAEAEYQAWKQQLEERAQ